GSAAGKARQRFVRPGHVAPPGLRGPRGCGPFVRTVQSMAVALTVGDLLKSSNLPLALVAGGEGLDNGIRWVHVSELQDPTPFLKGGELLLTVGIGVGKTPAQQRAYLKRLQQAG